MQLANDLGTPALVGLLGLYTALAQALDDAAPPDFWERIMGPNGVMVLVIIIAALLYAANKKQRTATHNRPPIFTSGRSTITTSLSSRTCAALSRNAVI
jgi:hypothetical protein